MLYHIHDLDEIFAHDPEYIKLKLKLVKAHDSEDLDCLPHSEWYAEITKRTNAARVALREYCDREIRAALVYFRLFEH